MADPQPIPPEDLSRLHDLVEPEAVAWWPLAPGWYGLTALVLLLLLVLAFRSWKRWKADAYRREALHELAGASDPAAIGALLRRTALAEFPRTEMAKLSGSAWLDWLSGTGPEPLGQGLRYQLVEGVYAPEHSGDLTALRTWASQWIRARRGSPTESR